MEESKEKLTEKAEGGEEESIEEYYEAEEESEIDWYRDIHPYNYIIVQWYVILFFSTYNLWQPPFVFYARWGTIISSWLIVEHS